MSHPVDVKNVPAQITQLSISTFDYNELEKPVAKFLLGQANRIRRYVQATTIQIGKDLLVAKHYLNHGQFLRWVEHEIGMPARTAQAHMRVAQWASNKSAVVAHLAPTLLFILSAPSTPENFTREVIARIEAGEPIAPSTVRDQLRVARERMLDEHRPLANSNDEQHREIAIEHAAVLDAILILFLQLPPGEFNRVKTIMTDHTVLHDPGLSGKILAAFSAVQDRSNENSRPKPRRRTAQERQNSYSGLPSGANPLKAG
jgi:hypothetical protein